MAIPTKELGVPGPPMRRASHWLALGVFGLAALGAAPTGCGSTLSAPSGDAPADPSATEDAGAGEGGDVDATLDGAAPAYSDGTPTRVACVSALGNALSPVHGRLDGTLLSIVGSSGGRCPSDPDHLHLQVKMSGAVYDIAVNLDGFEGETDAPLPGIPYAEGWHPMSMDYVQDLGLHGTALTTNGKAAVRARVESQLMQANHISVFGTGYPGSDGAHLIHRNPSGHDGALVIYPLAARAHVIAFRFASDAF